MKRDPNFYLFIHSIIYLNIINLSIYLLDSFVPVFQLSCAFTFIQCNATYVTTET